MRDRLIELIGSKVCEASSPMCDEANNCRIGELADHLLANGVIVPPCKAGDTVWFELYGQIESATVYHCTYDSSHRGFVLSGAYAKDTRGMELSFDGNSIGKGVFLTREEAERALKGGDE